MSQVTFEYKCRRCGTVMDGAIGGNKLAPTLLFCVMEDDRDHLQSLTPSASMIGKFAYHSCEDGGTGVADIIGYREVK